MTVVVATYNRSNVLRYALDSLVAQSHSDWEAVIVGDRCTDDSEAVVASFGDARMTWVNLPRNLGEQSGPNSVGARMSRGSFIAWLNHDDMWSPVHLEHLLEVAQRHEADFVVSAWLAVGPHSRQDLDAGRLTAEVWNATPRDRLDPRGVYPASTWLVDARLVRRIGDWRPASTLRAAPSQDFVYRCWASGARMRLTGRPSVVAIQSGRFEGAYATRRASEHEAFAPLVASNSPEGLMSELHATVPPPPDLDEPPWRHAGAVQTYAWRQAYSAFSRSAVPMAARLGWGPNELKAWAKGRSAGAFMAELHAQRGIERRGSG